jgi:hypothetical protein
VAAYHLIIGHAHQLLAFLFLRETHVHRHAHGSLHVDPVAERGIPGRDLSLLVQLLRLMRYRRHDLGSGLFMRD